MLLIAIVVFYIYNILLLFTFSIFLFKMLLYRYIIYLLIITIQIIDMLADTSM